MRCRAEDEEGSFDGAVTNYPSGWMYISPVITHQAKVRRYKASVGVTTHAGGDEVPHLIVPVPVMELMGLTAEPTSRYTHLPTQLFVPDGTRR